MESFWVSARSALPRTVRRLNSVLWGQEGLLSLSRLRGMPRTEDAAQAREFTQPALASRLPIAPSDAAWDACRRKLSSEHVSALCACGPGCGDLRTPVLSSATSADPVGGLPGIIPELHEVGGSVGLCQPPAGPSARRCTSHARTRRSYSAVCVCVWLCVFCGGVILLLHLVVHLLIIVCAVEWLTTALSHNMHGEDLDEGAVDDETKRALFDHKRPIRGEKVTYEESVDNNVTSADDGHVDRAALATALGLVSAEGSEGTACILSHLLMDEDAEMSVRQSSIWSLQHLFRGNTHAPPEKVLQALAACAVASTPHRRDGGGGEGATLQLEKCGLHFDSLALLVLWVLQQETPCQTHVLAGPNVGGRTQRDTERQRERETERDSEREGGGGEEGRWGDVWPWLVRH